MAPPKDDDRRIESLEEAREKDSALLADVRERLIRVETQLAALLLQANRQTERSSDAFFRFGWPLVIVIITAVVTRYIGVK